MTKIVRCGRTIAGGYVAYDVQWEGSIEGSLVLWSLVISSADESESVRVVHERTDGEATGQYIEDLTTGSRQTVEPDADCRDQEITVRFPENLVGVAIEWPLWRVVLTVDGSDISSMIVPLR